MRTKPQYKVQFKNHDAWEESFNAEGTYDSAREARAAANRFGAPKRQYRITKLVVVGKPFFPSR